VNISLSGKYNRGSRSTRITTLANDVVEAPALTSVAGTPSRNHVVAWTEQFEVVHVVQHRYALCLQFPEDRRREVVVDVAHVRNIRTEIRDHPADFFSRLRGVDRAKSEPYCAGCSAGLFKVRVGS